jgi:hypothetical protein
MQTFIQKYFSTSGIPAPPVEAKEEEKCPEGHVCTSNCRRNGCPCDEHEHTNPTPPEDREVVGEEKVFIFCKECMQSAPVIEGKYNLIHDKMCSKPPAHPDLSNFISPAPRPTPQKEDCGCVNFAGNGLIKKYCPKHLKESLDRNPAPRSTEGKIEKISGLDFTPDDLCNLATKVNEIIDYLNDR